MEGMSGRSAIRLMTSIKGVAKRVSYAVVVNGCRHHRWHPPDFCLEKFELTKLVNKGTQISLPTNRSDWQGNT